MNDLQRSELVIYRINKAKETLSEIDSHFQNKFWNTCVNRLYYACFYAVTALLTDKGLHAKTHSGTKQMFGLNFVKPGIISERSGNFYTNIFDMRQEGDYEDFLVFTEDEVTALIQPARDLIAEIEQVLSKQ